MLNNIHTGIVLYILRFMFIYEYMLAKSVYFRIYLHCKSHIGMLRDGKSRMLQTELLSATNFFIAFLEIISIFMIIFLLWTSIWIAKLFAPLFKKLQHSRFFFFFTDGIWDFERWSFFFLFFNRIFPLREIFKKITFYARASSSRFSKILDG